MKPLRIALVLDRFDPNYGGLESWAGQWSRWLAGRGHDVHVAAFDVAPGVAGPGVVPHVLPPASGRLARAAEAEGFLGRLVPDLVHDLGVGWRYDILQPQAGSRLANARRDRLSLGRWARFRLRLSPWHARRAQGVSGAGRASVRARPGHRGRRLPHGPSRSSSVATVWTRAGSGSSTMASTCGGSPAWTPGPAATTSGIPWGFMTRSCSFSSATTSASRGSGRASRRWPS